MKLTSLVLILILYVNGFSQNIKVIDSVANDMCQYLMEIGNIENDTLKINTLYKKKLYPYLYTINQKESESVAQKIYFRLQRGCVGFRNLLDRLNPPVEISDRNYEKPESKITKSDLIQFKNLHKVQYFEVNGNLTRSTFNNGYWIDNFTDGTYSKLHFKWISNTEFELIFIESNNDTRKDFSVPGDKYVYQILNKKDDYFNFSINIPGQNVYESFKFYFDK